MTANDEKHIRRAIEIAWSAREKGNHPFGALLVDAAGTVLMEAENSVITERDITGHAELNLVRMGSAEFTPSQLATSTLYTSTEPCAMCSGAIFWGNVGRVVFGLSMDGLYKHTGTDSDETLFLPCRDVLAIGKKPIEVIGPILEDEAIKVHEGFW